MARLFITVGYEENSNRPHLVYLSEDGAQQKQVAAQSRFPRLVHFANPVGIRKVNPAAAANAAREAETIAADAVALSAREKLLADREAAIAARETALQVEEAQLNAALEAAAATPARRSGK